MITLRLGERHSRPEYARELIDAIKRNPKSCDVVWFSSLYGYPAPEMHKKEAEKITEISNLYKENGIRVSIQISNTIGHGEYMKSKDCSGLVYPGSPVEKLVGPDGTVANYCFCWRGENFRKYMEETTKYYAQAKPECMWLDDDLRADNHAPAEFGCFCDNCIAEFNNRYGSNFDRAALVYEINYGDVKWRERFIEFTREGLADFTAMLSKAIVSVSPDTSIGREYAHWCNFAGKDDNYIFDAMLKESGKVPPTRPGGGFYCDKTPMLLLEKSMRLASTNSLVPDYITDKLAEIENLPDVVFGKSIGGTLLESTLYLADGCTGVTYATIMSPHEPIEWHEKMFAGFSKLRPYWEKLSEISKTCYRSGLAVYKGESPYKKPLKADDEPFSWMDIIYETDAKLWSVGIPVTHDQRAPKSYLLHHDMIDHLTDKDIAELLTMPVLTDADAVKKLIERGYGKHFKIKLTSLPQRPHKEVFNSHSINGENDGVVFTESSFFNVPMNKFSIIPDGDGELLGELADSVTNEVVGGSAVLTHTFDKDGNILAQWAVFGYCVWNDVISYAKRNQILNAVDALNPLPAKLISAEQAIILPTVDKSGKTKAVTVACFSPGGTDDLELMVRNPAGKDWSIMGTFTETADCILDTSNEVLFKLPPLRPYEIITVFFD